MHVAGRLTIASVGSTMAGSGRSSNRTSRAPYNMVPCICALVSSCRLTSFVLIVGHVFEPLDGLAIELLLHGDVGHRGGRRRAVPVLFTRREPDDVARPDVFDRAAPALRASRAGGHDQGLTERMRVPRGARAGLEGDRRGCRPRGRA